MARKWFFTSESVTEGHPDKVCDQISDAVLDAILAQDPNAHVACETATTTGMVVVMGEITTTATVDIPSIVREVVCDIGYDNASAYFDGHSCAVLTAVHEQSPDIAMGVNNSMEARDSSEAAFDDEEDFDRVGAGDQGMMFGYACDETEELMPLPISLAHKLSARLTAVRKDGTLPYLRPDGKTQVTVEYDENGDPVRLDTIVVSTQHSDDVSLETIRRDLITNVILPIVPPALYDAETRVLVNPTGRFVIGGPHGDSGLTGRKIIVDTYGGTASHGGGAFSGKDPTKVARSAAYMARYVAKNIVAAGFAKRCEVQLAYAIGVANPVSIHVNTDGTGTVADDLLERVLPSVFDFRPAAIIHNLQLRQPIYRRLAAYGHMGREDLGVAWEQTDRVDALKAAVAAAQ